MGPRFAGKPTRRVRLLGGRDGAARGRTSRRSSSSGSTSRLPSSATRARQSGTRSGACTTAPSQPVVLDVRPGRRRLAALPELLRAATPAPHTTERGWQVVQVAPWEADDWQVGKAGRGGEGARRVRELGGSVTVMGLDTHAREPEHGLCREAAVQHRRSAGAHLLQPGALERDRQRREHVCRHRQVRCRGRRPLRGAVARGVLTDHRARFLSRERSPGRGGRSGDGSELAAASELANRVAAANRAGLDDLRVQAP